MNNEPTKNALKHLDALNDDEIDYSDIPELDDEFFRSARVAVPPGKKQLTIRLDRDVLSWLKSQGRDYQSRIDAILRAYYEAHRDASKSEKRPEYWRGYTSCPATFPLLSSIGRLLAQPKRKQSLQPSCSTPHNWI